MTQKSFRIEWSSSQDEALVSEVKDGVELWHKRLGHIGYKRLQQVQEKKLIDGMPIFKVTSKSCEACNLGKQSRKGFPKESFTKTKEKLELVHMDVCGPMQNVSLEGSRFFVLFLDDYTHMCWVYFLKHKSECYLMFKKFKALVEKQSQCLIKMIRSDGGGEFTSSEFKNFCEKEGIGRQVTLPYSPQQNGCAERMNRSIVEMARTMLMEQHLPLKMWAEAVYTSVYIQNRLPSKAIEDDTTPFEKWSEHKPNVSHLRIFGSMCYVHVPNEKRRKWDAKSKRGILLGYSNKSKGYRIYLLDEEKIQVSRDVVVEENKRWDWELKKEVKKEVMFSVKHSTPYIEEIEDNRNEDEPRQDVQREEESPMVSRVSNTSERSNGEREMRPKRFKSMNEILQSTPRIDVEEAAQVIEACFLMSEEPQFFEEAYNDLAWREAMDEEINMILKNKTWSLVKKPKDKNVISVKWIYRLKTDANGSPIKCKARLVARDFSQEYGIDYEETFAPVSRYDTIRALLAYSAHKGWKLFQLDVKSAFLNGDLKEEVYVQQPPGYVSEGEEEKVLRLHKALYGLKQAPRAWYGRIDAYFEKNDFKKSTSDAALYTWKDGAKILIISLYVDDIIITGNDEDLIKSFKETMKREFEMTDLGLLSYFLGMEVNQEEGRLSLTQEKYAKRLITKFGMELSKGVNTPLTPKRKCYEEKLYENQTRYRSIVGGLLYLCSTRPDIMYASGYLSRYMSTPREEHYQEAKRVLRYVKETASYGLHFNQEEDPKLIGFSDSDWGGCVEDKKSTTGYVFRLGSSSFCWQSTKQQTVAQSTAEAEYMALCSATNQAIWLQRLFEEFGMTFDKGIQINCDNRSAIAIGRNPVQHKRTKHIEIKYHFVREAISKGLIDVKFCPSNDQIADIFTKALGVSRFEDLRRILGVHLKI